MTFLEQTMSSREIAELTSKRHDHVLRDCDLLNEIYQQMGLPKIGETPYYHPQNGRVYREYRLTKLQTLDLMTGYSTPLRIKVNRRWAELEAKAMTSLPPLPTSYKEAVQSLLTEIENNERLEAQNLVQQKLLAEQASKVLFANTIIGTPSSCLIGELAKLITQKGHPIGEKRLFQWLREHHYLGQKGERYNIPNQQYVERGLFELKKYVYSSDEGTLRTCVTPKVTTKGQAYFIQKFLSKNE